MRRRLALLSLPVAALWAALLLFPAGSGRTPTRVALDRSPAILAVSPVAAAAAPSAPSQDLPPGAVKHPGEKCATTIQPPDGQGCPGPPSDQVNGHRWCVGSPYAVGECRAAELGFFAPAVNFQPRNRTESCINRTENGGGYDRSRNSSHFGRWQFDRSLWAAHGGQPGDWGYASPGEQDMVFVATVAVDGYWPWTPFDGC